MMTFNYTMSADLYQKMLNDMQVIFTMKADSKKIYAAYMFLIFITTVSIIFLLIGMGISPGDKHNLFIAAVILVISFPFSWLFNRKFVAAYTESIIGEYKNSFNIEQEVTLDESGIGIKGRSGTANLLWAGIGNIYATRYFLIFIGDYLTFTIPNDSIIHGDVTALNEIIVAIENMSGKKVTPANAVLVN